MPQRPPETKAQREGRLGIRPKAATVIGGFVIAESEAGHLYKLIAGQWERLLTRAEWKAKTGRAAYFRSYRAAKAARRTEKARNAGESRPTAAASSRTAPAPTAQPIPR